VPSPKVSERSFYGTKKYTGHLPSSPLRQKQILEAFVIEKIITASPVPTEQEAWGEGRTKIICPKNKSAVNPRSTTVVITTNRRYLKVIDYCSDNRQQEISECRSKLILKVQDARRFT